MSSRPSNADASSLPRAVLDDYPVERSPDYVPGKPPQLDALHKAGYLDELEAIWGKRTAKPRCC
ncbi:MAG: hypothetical protein ACE5FI_14020 [Anaerolineales bacterium]